MNFRTIFCIVLIVAFSPPSLSEDYYELLGIKKDANGKEIRRAFKKLALSLHPDKNIGDKKAHEKFVTINRAYEVLKDNELRKKYDHYGEEGLDDSKQQQWGKKFHSWNYYQNDFGIYDDDLEIITLGYSDFIQSVKNSPDSWFINFYSPQCSHCHTLAPVWRKVAIELEGIVRIGAVNCGEDWHLCSQQGIQSYPSLKLYPENIKFQGDRNFEDLIAFVMKRIPNNVLKFTDVILEENLNSRQPWLLFFCDYSEDCMSPRNKRKLAAMLDEIVAVGDIDCSHDPSVCKHFKKTIGTYFYDSTQKVDSAIEIKSFDTKDIVKIIFELLPDIPLLKEKEVQDNLIKLESLNEAPWLIHFFEDPGQTDFEFKKLPKLLPHMNFGKVNCRHMRTLCNSYNVHKYPSFLLFKTGGGHEIYHGRMNVHDIAVFARESGTSPVRSLSGKEFPNILSSGHPIFIDFFAPWCPPCLQLLPEWRKAAKLGRNIAEFGTIDCTVHAKLCQKFNIRSYPTTIFYNNSNPHQYHGQKTAYHLVEFIKDVLNPSVVELDQTLFNSVVKKRTADVLWVIDYYSPWCGPCQQLSPQWRKLAKMMKNNTKIHIGQVDCTSHSNLCHSEDIRSYPNIRLYPLDKSGSSNFYVYDDWNRDAASIRSWIYQFLPSAVKHIGHKEFMEHVLKDTKAWLIDFYAPWCGHCQVFSPVFEGLAESLHGKVKLAKVNCDKHSSTCEYADVNAYPTVKFYPGSSKGSSQNMWGEEMESLDEDYILSYVEQRIKNLKSYVKDEL